MESNTALTQLSALAHDRRLDVFRRLIKAGPRGLPAGQIAEEMGVPANTLSAQLNLLSNAGLIENQRDGRSIIYRANFRSISNLLVFLMEDCCGGEREICAPVLKAAQAACCPLPKE